MVKREAQDAIFGARLFFNGIMIATVALFLYYDNDLQKSILSFNFPYFLSFFGLYGLCYYLFYTTGSNPGFVDLPQEEEEKGAHIELTVGISEQEGSETLLESGTGSSDGESTIQRAVSPGLQEKSDNETNKKKKSSGVVEQRYCEYCKVYQPYRTKHCEQCERCIHKFDHHCFWVGGCVGELNHGKFWLFLFFQTILEVWAYIIADSGLDASYTKGSQIVKTAGAKSTSPYTTTEYGAFMTLCVILFLAILFTGILGGFHTFLILTNQTTWEYASKEKITYLNIYPTGFYPFSRGLLGNIKLIFFHRNRLRNWELPSIDYSRQKRGFNWCENEYWSCC